MTDSNTEIATPLLDKDINSINAPLSKEDYLPPLQKWMYMFPESMEDFTRSFDDFVIKHTQRWQSKWIIYADLVMTGIVAIETGIATPFVLFVLGFDGLGTEISYLMLLLALFSQIPKRFIWRYRPYMANRALKSRPKETAVTSSFPSRAVTCGVVYSFVIVYAYMYRVEQSTTITWWMPIFVIAMTLLSSFARVNLGVHYPSDCVGGFFQGAIVCVIGTLLWRADIEICASCFANGCYSDITSAHAITKYTIWHKLNFVTLFVSLAIATLVTAVSVMKPIDFWGKCDRVYGMLVPGIIFQLTFLCPKVSSSSLPPPAAIPWYAYFYAFGFVLVATGVQYKNNGKHPITVFLVSFFILYVALLVWRVYIL